MTVSTVAATASVRPNRAGSMYYAVLLPVVWADAAGSKLQVAEQETAGLAAGLPHAVVADLANGL